MLVRANASNTQATDLSGIENWGRRSLPAMKWSIVISRDAGGFGARQILTIGAGCGILWTGAFVTR